MIIKLKDCLIIKDSLIIDMIISLLTKKLRYSHLNKNKTKACDLNKIDVNLMPYIFCIYKRLKFKSYYELRRKCKEIKKYKYVF